MNSNGKTPVVIFSLNEKPGKTGLDILQELGIPYKDIEGGIGCFEGKREQCYAIQQQHFTDVVKQYLKDDGQQCVMHLDNQYNAWLAYADYDYGNWNTTGVMPTYLGVFKEVGQTQAEKRSGWSRFGGKYYVAGK